MAGWIGQDVPVRCVRNVQSLNEMLMSEDKTH